MSSTSIQQLAPFQGIRAIDLQAESAKSKWIELPSCFLAIGSAAVAARKYLPLRINWIPSDARIQAIFTAVSFISACMAGYTYLHRRSAQKVLFASIDDKRAPLTPKQLGELWENPATHSIVFRFLNKCNFSQLQTIWGKLSNEIHDQLELDLKAVQPNKADSLLSFDQMMKAIMKAKTASVEEAKKMCAMLCQPTFTLVLKKIPGLFEAFRVVLLQRTDHDFRSAIFKIYYTLFLPVEDLSGLDKEKVTVTIVRLNKENQETSEKETLENVDLAILRLLGTIRWGQQGSTLCINLSHDCQWSPSFMKDVIQKFTRSEEPSLDWLLQNYDLLTTYQFETYLYRLHQLLRENITHLSDYTPYTIAEIAYKLHEHRPPNIKKLQSTWEQAQPNSSNILLAMTYAEIFRLVDLTNQCGHFIESSITDPQQFYDVFNHAAHLENLILLQACQSVLKRDTRGLHTQWSDLFDMPNELIAIIAQKTQFKDSINWKDPSSVEKAAFNRRGGFTVQQLMKTIESLASKPNEEIHNLLKLEWFVELIRNCPSLFGPLREQLLLKGDVFILPLHRIYLDVFFNTRPSASEEKVPAFVIQQGAITVSLNNMPRAILHSAGDTFAKQERIQLEEGRPYTPHDVQTVLQRFAQSKEFSFEQLLDHYDLLIDLNFKPLVVRFYQFFVSYLQSSDLFNKALHKYSRKQIAELLTSNPPRMELNIDLNQIRVDTSNILLVTSLERKLFKNEALREKILRFVNTELVMRPSAEQISLFKDLYELSQSLNDNGMLKLCQKVAADNRHQVSYLKAWDLFEAPPELMNAVMEAGTEDRRMMTIVGYQRGALLKEYGS